MARRDYAAEYQRRIANALRAGKTPHEARGHHPREKPATRVRKKSLAFKLGYKLPTKEIVKRTTFSHDGRTRRKKIVTTQEVYSLSHLYPADVSKALRKVVRRIRTLLFGKTDAPRVQWRMTVYVFPNARRYRGIRERATPWTTETKEIFDADRVLSNMEEACYMYDAGIGQLPEAVQKPIAVFLDRV